MDKADTSNVQSSVILTALLTIICIILWTAFRDVVVYWSSTFVSPWRFWVLQNSLLRIPQKIFLNWKLQFKFRKLKQSQTQTWPCKKQVKFHLRRKVKAISSSLKEKKGFLYKEIILYHLNPLLKVTIHP